MVMPDAECIELAKLVGFRVDGYTIKRSMVYGGDRKYYRLVFPESHKWKKARGSEAEAWFYAPNFKAPHDGLAELSRWVWPVLKEKGLFYSFVCAWAKEYDINRELPLESNALEVCAAMFEDITNDLPGQVTAAISVLEGK